MEILLIVGVVEGVGLQGRQPPLLVGPGRHGGDHGGVQPAGEQGTQGHVTDQLAADGGAEQLFQMFHRLLIVLGMYPAGHVPVPANPEPLRAKGQLVGGLQLPDALEHPFACRPGRGDPQHLPPGGLVSLGGEPRVAEQSLGLGAKDKGLPYHGVKEGLYAKPVPAAEQPRFASSQTAKA